MGPFHLGGSPLLERVPHPMNLSQLGTKGPTRWVCTFLTCRAGPSLVRDLELSSRILGLRGGFPFECKTDCALASPCSGAPGAPGGRRVDACSRSRCLVGLLFGLGYFCLLLCNWGANLESQETLCHSLFAVCQTCSGQEDPSRI